MIDLKQERKRRGYTQSRLAQELGIPRSSIASMETGRMQISGLVRLWVERGQAGEDAYNEGVQAQLDGKNVNDCPYKGSAGDVCRDQWMRGFFGEDEHV